MLAPLQLPYALALGAKNIAYGYGLLRARSLRWPVLSVGNLSAGGSGKTPVVLALAQLLQKGGFQVDVLSRGYGRRSPVAVERVDPAGDAGRFGDEPMLLARAGRVPVYVGASRWKAGRLAEMDGGREPGVHLLDDGFQHRKLARSVDLVVIHPADLRDRLLPAGRLREPVAALARADVLLLREGDAAGEALLASFGIHKPVWHVRRTLAVPPVSGPAVAFCGIARPGEFFADLRAAGVVLAGTLAFPDHHRLRPRDMLRIRRRASGASALLLTEKDFVRLGPEIRGELEQVAPLLPVPLRAEFLDAAACLEALLPLLEPGPNHSAAMRK